MKRLFITSGLFIYTFFSVLAQDLTSLSKSIGLLTFRDTKSNSTSYATASLRFKKLDSSHFHVFLVTNKHCIPTSEQSNFCEFRIRKNIGNIDSFSSVSILIYDAFGNYKPYVKVSPSNDVVVINFTSFFEDFRYLENNLIDYNLLASKKLSVTTLSA